MSNVYLMLVIDINRIMLYLIKYLSQEKSRKQYLDQLIFFSDSFSKCGVVILWNFG